MRGKLNWSQAGIVIGCLALLALLGWVDYQTGYELGFFIFYSIPVGLAAWYVGRWPGIGVSLAAALAWWSADAYAGEKYSSLFYLYWNNAIHFISFVVNAVTIAGIRKELDRRHQLAAELEAARSALREAAMLLRSCPGCGKPRVPAEGGDPAPRGFLLQHRAELADALCDDCRAGAKENPGVEL